MSNSSIRILSDKEQDSHLSLLAEAKRYRWMRDIALRKHKLEDFISLHKLNSCKTLREFDVKIDDAITGKYKDKNDEIKTKQVRSSSKSRPKLKAVPKRKAGFDRRAWVIEQRRIGATYKQIGDALGVTATRARQLASPSRKK